MRSRTLLTGLAVFLLFVLMSGSITTSNYSNDFLSGERQAQNERHVVLSQLTPHAPIDINSNSDFTALGFPGNGSESNPYRIENLDILGSFGVFCISIGGSVTAYYEIRGCRLSGAFPGAAIDLYAGRGFIDNCEISNCSAGIVVEIDDLTIESCEIYNTTEPISVPWNFSSIENVTVRDCIFYDANELVFEIVSRVTLTGNTFTETGVYIGNSSVITVSDNIFNVEDYIDHLGLQYCEVGMISDNVFNINNLCGVQLKGSEDIIIQNCDFISSGPSGFYGIDSRGFEGMRDITIEKCTFVSVSCDAGFVEQGLDISRCTLTNGSIVLVDSPFADVQSNTLSSGVILVGGGCNETEIYNNTLNDCSDYGIRVMDDNAGLIISTNSVKKTFEVSTSLGIDIESDNIVVRYNTVENFGSGIFLSEAEGCTIHNNTVFGNDFGIKIEEGSSFNHLYYNILYGNLQNAIDDGSDNTWDDGVSLGNYWSNLGAPGEYTVPGTAGSIDRYAQPYGTGLSILLELVIVGVIAAVVVIAVVVVKLRR